MSELLLQAHAERGPELTLTQLQSHMSVLESKWQHSAQALSQQLGELRQDVDVLTTQAANIAQVVDDVEQELAIEYREQVWALTAGEGHDVAGDTDREDNASDNDSDYNG